MFTTNIQSGGGMFCAIIAKNLEVIKISRNNTYIYISIPSIQQFKQLY